jgi:hypothetical protein
VVRRLATTPDPEGAKAAHATLVGQIVQASDGTLIVARFGKPGGGFGGIAFVNPASGSSGVVPNLDPARKRLGLTWQPTAASSVVGFAAAPGEARKALSRAST